MFVIYKTFNFFSKTKTSTFFKNEKLFVTFILLELLNIYKYDFLLYFYTYKK